jgi:hypothetical protein
MHQRPQPPAVQLGGGRPRHQRGGLGQRLALLLQDQPVAQPGDEVAEVARPARGGVDPHHQQQVSEHAGFQQPPVQLAQDLERALAIFGGHPRHVEWPHRRQPLEQRQAEAGRHQRRFHVRAQVAPLDERHLGGDDLLPQ